MKIYIKTGCPWCVGLIDFLDEKGVNYKTLNVTENSAFFDEMVKISGQTKAPTVILNGEVIADTDKDQIGKILIEKGIIN